MKAVVLKPTPVEAWANEVNARGLCAMYGPDKSEIVIFNDNELERGCMQVKADGSMWGARDGGMSWRELSLGEASMVMHFLANG